MSTSSAAFEIQRILVPTANWQLGSNCSNNYNTHTHAHSHTLALSDKNALPTFAGFESVAIAKRRNYLCAAYCVCNLYAYNTRTHTCTQTHTHRVAFAYSPPPPSFVDPAAFHVAHFMHFLCAANLSSFLSGNPRTPRCSPLQSSPPQLAHIQIRCLHMHTPTRPRPQPLTHLTAHRHRHRRRRLASH